VLTLPQPPRLQYFYLPYLSCTAPNGEVKRRRYHLKSSLQFRGDAAAHGSPPMMNAAPVQLSHDDDKQFLR